MSTELYFLIMAAVAGTVTILLRAFPFIMFSGNRPVPPVINYIGKVIPPAAIAMLVVYCLCSAYQGKPFIQSGGGVPELIASVLVVALQLWRRNPLLSIISGTVVYMIMVQNW